MNALLQDIGAYFLAGSTTSITTAAAPASDANKESNDTAVTNERVVDLRTLIFFGMSLILYFPSLSNFLKEFF